MGEAQEGSNRHGGNISLSGTMSSISHICLDIRALCSHKLGTFPIFWAILTNKYLTKYIVSCKLI